MIQDQAMTAIRDREYRKVAQIILWNITRETVLIHRLFVLKGLKNARISSAKSSGSSRAVKCPPRGIEVQRVTFRLRMAHSFSRNLDVADWRQGMCIIIIHMHCRSYGVGHPIHHNMCKELILAEFLRKIAVTIAP